MKKPLLTLSITLSVVLIASTAVYALGTLTPTGTAGDDTQYSLNDIFDKLTDFTDAPTATSSPFTVLGTAEATFHTLTEIYNLLTAEDADLVAGNIKDGVTIFGVTGELVEGIVIRTEFSQLPSVPGLVDYNWQTSVDYCLGLVEGGHTDWELPSALEVWNAQKVLQDPTFYPSASAQWTSTVDGSSAMVLDTGSYYFVDKLDEDTVQDIVCVR